MSKNRCRAIKTTQERRANGRRNFIYEDGYRVKIRSRRNMINLVDSWDDIWGICQRNWKSYRKTQYKEISMKLNNRAS